MYKGSHFHVLPSGNGPQFDFCIAELKKGNLSTQKRWRGPLFPLLLLKPTRESPPPAASQGDTVGA